MAARIPLPPPGLDIYESQQPSIYAATFISWGLAVIAVVLRFTARKISKANFWWDDWLMIVALVTFPDLMYQLVLMKSLRSSRHLHPLYHGS